MITNKYYIISFLLFFITACEKKINRKETKIKADTTKVLSPQIISSSTNAAENINSEKSFVISCGSGCAMTYNATSILRNNNEIKVDFVVETFIDEVSQDSQKESYFFYYDQSNKLIKIKKEGENGNFLETQTQDTQDSFRAFANSLIKNTTKSTAENSIIYDKITNPRTVKYNLISVSSIRNLNKFSCDEKNARYISLPNKNDVRLFLVPQDCGDFNYRYFLLSIKNSVVMGNLYVEGEWYEPEDDGNKEITSFSIDSKYNIKVKTQNISSTKIENYRITNEGEIVKL